MGWDDSDDSDDESLDLDAVMRENEKRRRREAGEPSESEEEEEAEEEVVKHHHKPKEEVEVYVPLADPVAEKARQKKMQEELELKAIEGTFGGEFVKVDEEAERKKVEEEAKAAAAKAAAKKKAQEAEVRDEFVEMKVETTAQFDSMATKIINKVKESPLKGGSVRFINEIVKLLLDDLSLAELESMDKKVVEMLKQKKVSQTEKMQKEQKGNVSATKNTKFNVADELNTMYGGGWDDGDWDDGDWDEEDWE